MTLRTLAASLLLAAPLLAGCRTDESLASPDLSNNGGLLTRYVAMGNSITAGFQSAGINDSTQQRSYAAVFARQAGAPYFYASLNMPGCPAPLTSNTAQTRVDNQPPTAPCALRAQDRLPFLGNVAVPGANVLDAVSNSDPGSAPNALTTFILGGRTQVEAMGEAHPTFVSVWLGNNDVLASLTSSANPGNPALVTPEAAFEAAYTTVLDSITASNPDAKAVLFGAVDVTAAPYVSTGTVYFCLKTGVCPGVPQAAFPPNFTVNSNCAPAALGGLGDGTLIPWTVGVVRILRAAQGLPGSVDCSVDADVVTVAERDNLHAAVTGYNTFIQAQAAARGWPYIDINAMLLAYRALGQIPPFPTLPTAPGGSVLFGPLFSLDGVHPSTAAHRIIADSLISTVNRAYGTSIPFAGP
jgi:lysophospholipase L1-like esterase